MTDVAKIRISVELSNYEKRKLKLLISGYGKLKDASEKSGLHFQTVKNVSRAGRGESKTIEKLRNTILNSN